MKNHWIIALGLTVLPALTLHAETSFLVLPAEFKVEKLDEGIKPFAWLWTEKDNLVRLSGAGGEHIRFQVMATCHLDTLRQVELSWTALEAGRSSIPADSLKAYLAALVKVYAPSGSQGKVGWYEDPLAPLSGPVDIFPDRWENHKNQPFWLDLHLPRGQAAGKYRGEVKLTADGVTKAVFPIEVTVWGFSLPEAFHYYSLFNCSKDWLRGYYREDRLGGRTLDDVLVQYFDFMLDRGIQPWFNPLLQPEMKEQGGQIVLDWPNGKWERHFLTRPAYQRVTFSAAPESMENLPQAEKFTPEFNRKIRDWVGGIYEHYKKNGWQDKLTFFGPLDEPNTREAYEELIRWGELVRSAAPGAGFQVTEQPVPQEPGWPSLAAVADDWVVHGGSLESNRQELLRLSNLGNHSSWYISCDQAYPMANYFIDEDGIDPRAVAWITWRYSIQGILYWAVNFWPEVRNPWSDPVTWKRSECNAPLAGEGSLIYPGEEIMSYCKLNNVEGPVSSIRFEMLLKGLEDVEYLFRLRELGLNAEAERLGMEIVISADTFSRDPARYEQVKAEAARLIERAGKRK
jgi:hypothetical protein